MTDIFTSEPPKITLVGAIQSPYDLSVATARTCYSNKGIVTPKQVSIDEKARVLRDRIAASTREAGHLTTRQHAHFVFSLENVSRQFIWEFLHSHPYYNSEQVSQRYVQMKAGNFTIPNFGPSLGAREKARFEETINLQMGTYEKLIQLVMPAVTDEYFRIFKSRRRNSKKWQRIIKKKAFEVARYVLPVSTQAFLYHTVSALTLMRYYKYTQQRSASSEQTFVIRRMVEEVLKIDPNFSKELDHVSENEALTPRPVDYAQAAAFTTEFDQALEGRYSTLIDMDRQADQTLAKAVRVVLTKTEQGLSTADAVDMVLNPAKNPDLGDTFNVTTLSPLSRALTQVHFTFMKKISHTGDSQNQRHRMTPAARPDLASHYFGEPDVIYPKVLLEVKEARKLFDDTVHKTVEVMNDLIKSDVPFEKVAYLLPNAWAVRFQESGDLLNWHHKWKLRTCYNAQEEIFYASVDELKQVSQQYPTIGKHILAPCYLRKQAGMRPYCPEGDRYCGVPVWNAKIEAYARLI